MLKREHFLQRMCVKACSIMARDRENAYENGVDDMIVGILTEKIVINHRRACAARVTVLGLSVRLLPRFLLPHVMKCPRSDTNGLSTTLAIFLKW